MARYSSWSSNSALYSFLMEVANYFATGDDHQPGEQDILLSALEASGDEKLTAFALRLVLTDRIAIPHDGEVDSLTMAAKVFLPKPEGKAKVDKPKLVKSTPAPAKKTTTRKKAA